MDKKLQCKLERECVEKKESMFREVYDYIIGKETDTNDIRLHRLNLLQHLCLCEDALDWFDMVKNELNG